MAYARKRCVQVLFCVAVTGFASQSTHSTNICRIGTSCQCCRTTAQCSHRDCVCALAGRDFGSASCHISEPLNECWCRMCCLAGQSSKEVAGKQVGGSVWASPIFATNRRFFLRIAAVSIAVDTAYKRYSTASAFAAVFQRRPTLRALVHLAPPRRINTEDVCEVRLTQSARHRLGGDPNQPPSQERALVSASV